MNEIEVLIKLIIPAILLIFWALSNLFNRENAAAQAKGTSSLGPRPTAYPAPRPADRARPPEAPPRYAPPQGADDDVLIIRSDAKRPPARAVNQPPGRPGNQQPPRRNPGRGKGPQVPQSRRPEPEASRQVALLDAKIATSVNQSVTKPMQIRPLTESVAATVNETSPSVPTMAVGPTLPSTIPDLRDALSTRGRIREAFLLNEILQPPMALRNRGRGRR